MKHVRKYRRILLAVPLLVLIVAAAFFAVSHSSLLAISHIEVDGNQTTPTSQIMATAGPMLTGRSLLSLSFDDVNRALDQLPFISEVDIERSFPHTIRLHVHEHHAVAWYRTGSQSLLLSGSGRVLKQQSVPDGSLPLLTTRDACAAGVGRQASCGDVKAGLSFLTGIPVSFDHQITEVSVADGDINFKTAAKVNIHFGPLDDYSLKFEVISQLIARTAKAGKTVTIDVSVPDRPVTKTN